MPALFIAHRLLRPKIHTSHKAICFKYNCSRLAVAQQLQSAVPFWGISQEWYWPTFLKFKLNHVCGWVDVAVGRRRPLRASSTKLHFPCLRWWLFGEHLYNALTSNQEFNAAFDVQSFEAKTRVFEFEYQKIYTFKFVRCSKRLCSSLFDE